MEIRGLKPLPGLSEMDSLSIALSCMEELLVDYEPPTFSISLDIEGAQQYAFEHDVAVCDLTPAEKERFIHIKKGDR